MKIISRLTMKNLLFIILLTLFCFYSCTQNKISESITSNNIKGEWRLMGYGYSENALSFKDTTVYECFYLNGKVSYMGAECWNYTILNDSLIIKRDYGKHLYKILQLTVDSLILLDIDFMNSNTNDELLYDDFIEKYYKLNATNEINQCAQYRDTIVGKFNGKEVDTLIAEPLDTTINRSFWDWRIYSKNNTVDTLILTQRFSVKMIQEGDLDGNGTDEFGIRRESDAGTWDDYYVYTFDNGEWKYLINPIWTYSAHFYTDLNNGNDVVESTNHPDLVRVRFSDIRNDDFCIVDTLIPIAPHSITSQE